MSNHESLVPMVLLAGHPEEIRPFLPRLRQAVRCEAVEAVDAELVVDLLHHGFSDIVLVDLDLSNPSGKPLIPRLHAAARGIPLIAYSSSSAPAQVVSALKGGAVDFLRKPLDPAEAARAIRAALAAAPPPTDHAANRSVTEDRHVHRLELLGRVTGTVAHELSNQITAIGCQARLLVQDYSLFGPHRAAILDIHQSAERMAAFTRQVLDFTHKKATDSRPLDLNRELAGMQRFLRSLLGERIHIVLDLAADKPYVNADPFQLEQVIINLAVNARDALAGEGTLTVSTANILLDPEPDDAGGVGQPLPFIMLKVNDNGSGMDAATQQRLFEPFFTTKPRGHGTGLGLVTIRRIVEESEGRIDVASVGGRGTTFTIYLPQIDALPAAAEEGLAVLECAASPATILAVEDDDGVRKVMRAFCGSNGYAYIEAAAGQDALRLAAKHSGRIDLAVVDVILPDSKGTDIAQELAKLRPDIKVLLTTGYDGQTVLGDFKPSQVTDFIEKPWTIEEFSTRLSRLLGGR